MTAWSGIKLTTFALVITYLLSNVLVSLCSFFKINNLHSNGFLCLSVYRKFYSANQKNIFILSSWGSNKLAGTFSFTCRAQWMMTMVQQDQDRVEQLKLTRRKPLLPASQWNPILLQREPSLFCSSKYVQIEYNFLNHNITATINFTRAWNNTWLLGRYRSKYGYLSLICQSTELKMATQQGKCAHFVL